MQLRLIKKYSLLQFSALGSLYLIGEIQQHIQHTWMPFTELKLDYETTMQVKASTNGNIYMF